MFFDRCKLLHLVAFMAFVMSGEAFAQTALPKIDISAPRKTVKRVAENKKLLYGQHTDLRLSQYRQLSLPKI